MLSRVLYTIFLICGIFFFNPIIFCMFALFGVALFKNYFEIVGILFLYEGTFSPVQTTFPFIATTLSLYVVFLVRTVRPLLRN